MLKSLNHTNRLEIPNALIEAKIEKLGKDWRLNIVYDFKNLELDPNWKVVMDIFVPGTTESRRYSLDGMSIAKPGKTFDLSDMINPADSKLRIKIIDSSGGPRIIKAQIDDYIPISDANDDNSRSLLPIKPAVGLISPWTLKFVKGVPTLYISDKSDLYNSLRSKVKAPWFYPVIMHDVFRQIFEWLAYLEGYENEKVAEKWKKLFIENYGCPEDFFETMTDKDDIEKREEVFFQARLVSDEVSRQMIHIEKIISLLQEDGD
jgi:hypothetical protein